MLPLTPNTPMSSLLSLTYQPSPETRDEPQASQLSDVPMVSDKGHPSSATCNRDPAPILKSPMAQLIQEYSSVGIESQLGPTESSVIWVLSLEELTPDLIVDRGEGRPHRYHLTKAILNNVCVVVTAQQTFIQRAAALIMERKSQFIVDPKDTLIHILQGTSSLPQLYVAWKVLISRMRLGVKTWEEYIAEYQLQVGTTALSPLST